jgi:hypothetical protein
MGDSRKVLWSLLVAALAIAVIIVGFMLFQSRTHGTRVVAAWPFSIGIIALISLVELTTEPCDPNHPRTFKDARRAGRTMCAHCSGPLLSFGEPDRISSIPVVCRHCGSVELGPSRSQ